MEFTCVQIDVKSITHENDYTQRKRIYNGVSWFWYVHVWVMGDDDGVDGSNCRGGSAGNGYVVGVMTIQYIDIEKIERKRNPKNQPQKPWQAQQTHPQTPRTEWRMKNRAYIHKTSHIISD